VRRGGWALCLGYEEELGFLFRGAVEHKPHDALLGVHDVVENELSIAVHHGEQMLQTKDIQPYNGVYELAAKIISLNQNAVTMYT
jgi:hypothetical protein